MNGTSQSDRSTVLLALVSKWLQESGTRHTELTLGDRQHYIGMSDIGRGISCMRSAVGHKLSGTKREQISDYYQASTLEKQLRLQRGHWFESGIGETLKYQEVPFIHQLEIDTTYQGVPIKAHLDFTFVSTADQPVVRILEIKSCEHIPATLYPSYEMQVYGQVGLLALLWDQPVFGIRDCSGNMVYSKLPFPSLVNILFGLDLPDSSSTASIEAWILCLSMGSAKAFGPYLPNDGLMGLCFETAKAIWTSCNEVSAGDIDFDDLPIAKGFYALCDWCEFNADCPKFDGQVQPGWASTLERLSELKNDQESIRIQIAEIEDGLKAAYRMTDMPGLWIESGTYRFKVTSQAGRKSLNKDLLRSKLGLLLGDEETAEILAQCDMEGKAFERLTVSPINQ